tara:strand:- start:137 stop:445 length:309 start_codon:yes stop_codon:yes gene_type:complete
MHYLIITCTSGDVPAIVIFKANESLSKDKPSVNIKVVPTGITKFLTKWVEFVSSSKYKLIVAVFDALALHILILLITPLLENLGMSVALAVKLYNPYSMLII